jgi:hypothetical protein
VIRLGLLAVLAWVILAIVGHRIEAKHARDNDR